MVHMSTAFLPGDPRMGGRGGGGGGGHVYLYYSGPRLCRVGPEEEVSQWALQFMPPNSDFPFQPTEPKRLSQQDLGWGRGRWMLKRQSPSLRSIKFYLFLEGERL